MTEKEIDLFTDADNSSEAVAKPINEKMYQVVDLKNGSYQFKRYNGSKAEERYTSLGYFKLVQKSHDDLFRKSDVRERKIQGNKSIRRAKSDVLTQLDNLLPLLTSFYVFRKTCDNLSEAEMNLANKYCKEIDAKFKAEKIIAELKAISVMVSDLGLLKLNNTLTPEQKELYEKVRSDLSLYFSKC